MITVKNFFSLYDDVSKHNVKVWLTLMKDMKWSNAKKHFLAALSEQWQVDDKDTVANQLDPYENHIQDNDTTVLSTYNPDTLAANRKAAENNKAKTFVAKKTAKKVECR